MSDRPCPSCGGTGVITTHFGERLRQLRMDAGMTVEEIAKILGLKSRAMVSHLETGRSQPVAHHLVVLAMYFDVSTDWLLGLTDDKGL